MDFADDGDLLQKIRKKVALNSTTASKTSLEPGNVAMQKFEEIEVWSIAI